jgi:hypothetical protein
LSRAPYPAWRLIPSRFPPIGAFDTVVSAADLAAVMELEGWTNDRLVAERLARLDRADWLFGVANASVVMASFLHAAPSGNRFSGPDLGAWYAAAAENTAIAEVAHHLRREAVARGLREERRTYRCYRSRLVGSNFLDIRGQQTSRAELYAPADYGASQVFGESARASGGAGLIYDSLRHKGGVNAVAYLPRKITAITQCAHYDVLVPASGKIIVITLEE